jgi:hypothetical protein
MRVHQAGDDDLAPGIELLRRSEAGAFVEGSHVGYRPTFDNHVG